MTPERIGAWMRCRETGDIRAFYSERERVALIRAHLVETEAEQKAMNIDAKARAAYDLESYGGGSVVWVIKQRSNGPTLRGIR